MSAWNFQDLTGLKFGKLTVIERTTDYISPSGNKIARWLCKCDCGNLSKINGASLKRGTSSCGCLQKEMVRTRRTKHQKSGTRLYRIWKGIQTRCYNPNHHSYKHYGGEGKGVCDEWRDFAPFYEWSMSNGYEDKLSIDRIDNSKGYAPDNCRWVSNKTQQNNTRRNHFITYNGKTQTLSQWAEEYNIPRNLLCKRLNELKWDIKRALTEPKHNTHKII